MEKAVIKEVYTMLKERVIHPSGHFDKGGRWYADNADLIDVRSPSKAWPYSQLVACRTKKYVEKVAEKYNCCTKEDLIKYV